MALQNRFQCELMNKCDKAKPAGFLFPVHHDNTVLGLSKSTEIVSNGCYQNIREIFYLLSVVYGARPPTKILRQFGSIFYLFIITSINK